MPEQSHVLIVDDNKDFLEIVSVYLGAKGFLTSVLHTEDGEGVLEACAELKPHVVLLDVFLSAEPRGFTIAGALRDDERTREAKILFWTSMADPGIDSENVFPPESFIDKTADLEHLAARVEAALAS